MRRLRRALVGLGLGLLVLGAGFWPANAWATSDEVQSWQVSYSMDTGGTLHVSETLVWAFGSNSGRHGIDRYLVTREPWGQANQDAVYTISNINVTSPDASAAFQTSTVGSGRNTQLDIRIGSANHVITAPTATYTISYDVQGAMRSDSGYDELYWDAIGDNTPIVNDITITARVPGGVQGVACYSGPAGTNQPCTSADVGSDGVATYTVATKGPSDIVTIGAKIGAGLVANNTPDLQQPGDQASRSTLNWAGGLTGGTAVATAVGVGAIATNRRRDQRFLGVAPGTIETSGQGVGPDNHPKIPVAFTPPKIPVAAAGLIDDGAVDVRDMTAALLSLAVRGAIQLRQDPVAARSWVLGGSDDQAIHAKLTNPGVQMAPHEAKLLSGLFPGLRVGTEKTLTSQGALYQAFQDMKTNVLDEAEQAGWYSRLPHPAATPAAAGAGTSAMSLFRLFFGVAVMIFAFGGAGLAGLVSGLQSGGVGWLLWVGPAVVLLIGFLVYRLLTHRGQRSALGRAYADQVTGFRQYLTTAEADQIKFEEGQDVFSQYLPWAVIYDIADRWTKVCAQLVADGRLTAIQPTWYYGDYRYFNMYAFTNSLGSINQASMPVQTGGGGGWSSGTGFGAGSAFGGGGGFSGGGGGGGGASSW